MDLFAEQLVVKIPTTSDDVKRAATIVVTVMTVIGSLVLTLMGLTIALLLAVGAVAAAVYLMKMSHVEYEYACTNGSLDIDKILGQDKRREMLSVEIKDFTLYGKASDCEMSDTVMTTFSAVGYPPEGSGGTEDTEEMLEEYYAEFEHPDHGKCGLYFTPNLRMREAIEPFLRRELKH